MWDGLSDAGGASEGRGLRALDALGFQAIEFITHNAGHFVESVVGWVVEKNRSKVLWRRVLQMGAVTRGAEPGLSRAANPGSGSRRPRDLTYFTRTCSSPLRTFRSTRSMP